MTMEINLPAHLETLILAEVENGHYQSPTDLVMEAVAAWLGIEPEFSPEQIHWIRHELGARMASVDNETAEFVSLDELMARLESKLS